MPINARVACPPKTVPHGKVLSPVDYTSILPKLPNLKCPVSGVHSTIILVEQNARMAFKLARRAYILQVGQITLEGNVEELVNNELVRKAYLGGKNERFIAFNKVLFAFGCKPPYNKVNFSRNIRGAMSEKNLRTGIFIVIIIAAIIFLAIVADVMRSHPALPWFGFGIFATLVVEVIAYGIYLLVKYIRSRYYPKQ
jgi:hypothetical protein